MHKGYSDSRSVLSARRALAQHHEALGVTGIDVDDVYLGHGLSELIVMAMQAMLDDGDQVLISAPDYPLWTAAVSLAGGTPVLYLCDEAADWYPDLDDLASEIPPGRRRSLSSTQTTRRARCTHATCSTASARWPASTPGAALQDEAVHIPTALAAPDVLCLTVGGSSVLVRHEDAAGREARVTSERVTAIVG